MAGSEADDSGDDADDTPMPKQRQHKFRRLAEQLDQVDVLGGLAAAAAPDAPRGSYASFTQEALEFWRESAAGRAWAAASHDLNDLALSLELVVHNAPRIVHTLLQHAAAPDGAAALPALAALLLAVARDVGADFADLLPRIFEVFTGVVTAAAGDAAALQAVFRCVVALLKQLHAHLLDRAPWLLQHSRGLRYHDVHHIRCFAAQAFGYVLRKVPHRALPQAVRCVLLEAAAVASESRVHGAGQLLAESVVAPAHALHSRAAALLATLLAEGIESTSPTRDAVLATPHGQRRAAAATVAAFDRCLQHCRRGGCQPLWDAALAALGRALAATQGQQPSSARSVTTRAAAASEGGAHADRREAAHARLAHSLALVAHLLEFYRGSRVEDFEPVLAAVAAAVAADATWSARPGLDSGPGVDAAARPVLITTRAEQTPTPRDFEHVTATGQTLRCVLAIVHAHGRAAGASAGPRTLVATDRGGAWHAVFSRAPRAEQLAFAAALLRPPTTAAALQPLLPRLLGMLGAAAIAAAPSDWVALDEPLALLAAALAAAPPQPVPRLLAAQPDGGAVASRVKAALGAATAAIAAPGAPPPRGAVAAGLAALRCLQDACRDRSEACAAAVELTAACAAALTAADATGDPLTGVASPLLQPARREDIVLLLSEATVLAAQHDAAQADVAALMATTQRLRALLRTHATHAPLLAAMAAVHRLLGGLDNAHRGTGEAGEARSLLSVDNLLTTLPLVQDALSTAPAARRAATALLATFEQPRECDGRDADATHTSASQSVNTSVTETSAAGEKGAASQQQLRGTDVAVRAPSTVIATFDGLQGAAQDLTSMRAAAVAVGGVAKLFEFGRVPCALVATVVRLLVGCADVPYSELRAPIAESLASALQSDFDIAWPVYLQALEAAQRSFLSSGGSRLSSRKGAGFSVPEPEESETVAPQKDSPLLALLERIHGADPFASGAAALAADGAAQQQRTNRPAARLAVLLEALAKAPVATVDRANRTWVPLAIAFMASKGGVGSAPAREGDSRRDAESAGEIQGACAVGGKDWRVVLAAWLEIVVRLKDAGNYHRAGDLRRHTYSHLTSIDGGVQRLVLRCLVHLKTPALRPYLPSLLALTEPKTLKATLARLCLERGGDVATGERAAVLPVIVRVLFPLMRKRSGRLAGRGALGSARTAILNKLASLESEELVPLLALFLGPMAAAARWAPGWEGELAGGGLERWLAHCPPAAVAAAPPRRRQGALNAVADLLAHLGFRLAPLLAPLVAVAVASLEVAAAAADAPAAAAARERALRAQALRVLAALLERFPAALDWRPLWPRLLAAAAPLAARLPADASAGAAAAPPLLALVLALSGTPHLLPLLADCPSFVELPDALQQRDEGGTGMDLDSADISVDRCGDAWAQARQGSALLRATLQALGSPGVTPPAADAALTVLENVFAACGAAVELALAPAADAAVGALHARIAAATAGGGRGGIRREVAALERVCPLSRSAETAGAAAAALAASVAARRLPTASAAQALRALATLWRRGSSGGADAAEAALSRLVPLLAPRGGGADTRSALVDALAAGAAHAPALAPAVAPLRALVAAADSADAMDSGDAAAAALAAYSGLTDAAWAAQPPLAAAALLHAAFHDLLAPDDLALRSAAAAALGRLVAAAAAPGTHARRLATGALHRTLLSTLAGKHPLPVTQEVLALLQRLAATAPGDFPGSAALTHEDPEADFFFNVAHVQLHRRTRAWQRLQRLVQSAEGASPLPLGTVQGLLVPLLHSAVIDGASGAAGGHGQKRGAADRAQNVVDHALDAATALARTLPWPAYLNLLSRFLKVCKGARDPKTPAWHSPIVQRNAVKAVCAVLDAFHFAGAGGRLAAPAVAQSEADRVQERMVQQAAGLAAPAPPVRDAQGTNHLDVTDFDPLSADTAAGVEAEAERDTTEAPAAAGAARKAVATSDEAIQRVLLQRILPALMRLLTKDKETVRAPVALAAVKLMRALPSATEHWQLPKVLQTVVNLLAARQQSVRDDARGVLIKIVRELGAGYMQYVCDVLTLALPARGFTAHVLVYTLHACLQALHDGGVASGALDGAAENILPLLEPPLFGASADSGDHAAFAKRHKEAKHPKAYDAYQLLWALTTFETHAEVLLMPVRDRLAECSAPAVRRKVAQLLQYAARGVAAAAAAGGAPLQAVLTWVWGQLRRGRERAAAAAAGDVADDDVLMARDAEERSAAETDRLAALHEPIVTEFALSLLSNALRKGTANPADPATRALLDPLVAPLRACLAGRDSACVALALKCLAALAPAQLPAMALEAGDIGAQIVSTLKRTPTVTTASAQGCVKLLAALLRACPEYAPPVAQLRDLVGWAFADLSDAASRPQLFSLLKAILDRKLVAVAEVHSVMTRLQGEMVRSANASLRGMAASALLQYLLDWPLEERRLKQHLHFAVANLAYELEDGRLQVLEFVGAIAAKFPPAFLSARFTLLFLPLVSRLSGEAAPACRRRVAEVLAALLGRSDAACRAAAAESCHAWLRGGDARLRGAALQTLSLLLGADGGSVARVRVAVPTLLLLLERHARCCGDNGSADDAAAGWREAYHALLLLEKLGAAAPETLQLSGDAPRLWEAALALLRHPHLWVQAAAARVVGAALARPELCVAVLALPTAPGRLALAFYTQLLPERAGAPAVTQATKCLVAVAAHLHAAETAANGGGLAQLGALPRRGQRHDARPAAGEAEDGESDGEAESVGASSLEESRDEGPSGDEGDHGADGTPRRVAAVTLRGLFRRMAALASDRRGSVAQPRGAALRWTAAVAQRLGGGVLTAHDGVLLRQLVLPLWRVQEGAGEDSDEVKDWCAEATAVVRAAAGDEAFAAAFAAARQTVAGAARERKRQAAVRAALDPEGAAQAKLRRNERKAADKKRKAATKALRKEAGLDAKRRRHRPRAEA